MDEIKKQEIRRAIKIMSDMPYEEIRDLLEEEEISKTLAELSNELPVIKLGKILRKLGMPSHLRGYNYTNAAVGYMLQEKILTGCITKNVYPYVAKQFNTKANCIERCIRHAITVTWERGNQDLLHKMFGTSINPDKCVPTNKEFLTTFVEWLSE